MWHGTLFDKLKPSAYRCVVWPWKYAKCVPPHPTGRRRFYRLWRSSLKALPFADIAPQNFFYNRAWSRDMFHETHYTAQKRCALEWEHTCVKNGNGNGNSICDDGNGREWLLLHVCQNSHWSTRCECNPISVVTSHLHLWTIMSWDFEAEAVDCFEHLSWFFFYSVNKYEYECRSLVGHMSNVQFPYLMFSLMIASCDIVTG